MLGLGLRRPFTLDGTRYDPRGQNDLFFLQLAP